MGKNLVIAASLLAAFLLTAAGLAVTGHSVARAGGSSSWYHGMKQLPASWYHGAKHVTIVFRSR